MNYLAGIDFPFESYNHQFLLDENGNLSNSYEEREALEKIFHCDDLHELWLDLWDSIDAYEEFLVLEEIEKLSYFP